MKYTRLFAFTVLATVLSLTVDAKHPKARITAQAKFEAPVTPPPPGPSQRDTLLQLAAPGKIVKADDVLAGKFEWVEDHSGETTAQLNQLTQAYQNLTKQRDAIAKQLLDTQLQLELAGQQLAALQSQAKPTSPPAKP